MKAITKNLIIFSIGLIIFTLIFRYALSSMLENRMFTGIWVLTVAYALCIFIIGWIFGKRDRLTLPLYDIGFRFHLATYLICNLIAEMWYNLGLQSQYENIKAIHLTVIIWGVFLLIHLFLYFISRKNAIRGIKKSEIFE